MASDESEPVPVRPQSPFVSNLRLQVALSRQTPQQQQWKHQPSVGTWLSPRSPRDRAARSSVNFAAENEVVLITNRKGQLPDRRLLELSFKGTCAKPFKLESIDASLTVRNVKELCEVKCNLAPDQQRLLYKGAILQDAQCLQDTHLPDKATLFLVKGATAASSSSSSDAREAPSAAEETAGDEEDMMEDRQHIVMMCFECGVNPGRLLTDGLCSYCFRELVVRENAALKKKREEAKRREKEALEDMKLEEQRKKEREEQDEKRQKNTTRCYVCNKKTGLTGFLCKCGYYFCAAHRYAEDHDCAFDHKAHGREILAQQNQKVQNNGLN